MNKLTDGDNSAGIGFMLYQNLDDNDPGKNVTISTANSSGLKDSQLAYSPVGCELLALMFATEACNYFLYGAAEVNVFTDCSALEGMFSKPMADIMGGSRIFDWEGPRIDETSDRSRYVAQFPI